MMTNADRERLWRRWSVPVLMFLVLTTLALSNDFRERRALRAACFGSNQDRALQNVSNDKTGRFLSIAATARRNAAHGEIGAKRKNDLRAAALYHSLAASYRHIPLRACPPLFPWQDSAVPDEKRVLENALKPTPPKP